MWAWIIRMGLGPYVEIALKFWREILIAVLAICLVGQAKFSDFKEARIEKRHNKEITALKGELAEEVRKGGELKNDLSISQANQIALEVALARSNAEVEQVRLAELQKRREAEERVAAERASRKQVEEWAEHLNERLAAEATCEGKVRAFLGEMVQ